MLNKKGFSLVELILTMAMFMGIMMISSYAFENMLKKGGQQLKSAETQTEGIVGLEMLRSDLEHVGFGLPWSTMFPLGAVAETSGVTGDLVTGVTSSAFNFNSVNVTDAPRAIQVGLTPADKKIIDTPGTDNSNPSTAYLVVKSNIVELNPTAKKWSYVNYSASAAGVNQSHVKHWGSADDFVTNDRVITIASTFTATGDPNKLLVMGSPTDFFYRFPADPYSPPADSLGNADTYKPGDSSQLYVVYGVGGVDPAHNLTMPYNRADFYVKKGAGIPASCNPGTGILYKAVWQQGGGVTEFPLLNCVGDMQVEFELDYNNDGNITYSPTLTGSGGAPLTAAEIRTQLKNIRVFILAHEGKIDRNFSYGKDTIQVGDPAMPSSSGRTWDGSAACTGVNCMQAAFGAEWRNYRWKVYTVVVGPKNLN